MSRETVVFLAVFHYVFGVLIGVGLGMAIAKSRRAKGLQRVMGECSLDV